MIGRLLRWLLTIAICVDQLVQVILRGPAYILFNAPRPSADETISNWVGTSADAGRSWALIARRLIDALFGSGHCQRAIVDDDTD